MFYVPDPYLMAEGPPIGKKIGRVPGVWDPTLPIYQSWARFFLMAVLDPDYYTLCAGSVIDG